MDSSDAVDNMTAEELLAAIDAEQQQHDLEVATLDAQRMKIQSLFDKRREHFRHVIERVTDYRIKISEMIAEEMIDPSVVDDDDCSPTTAGGDTTTPQPQSPQQAEEMQTGSEKVDQILGKLLIGFSKGKATSGPLLEALDLAVQVEGASLPKGALVFPPILDTQSQQRLLVTNKTTNVYFVSRNDIRGVKGWWEKHRKSCDFCGQKFAQWYKDYGVPPKALGGDAIPFLHKDVEGAKKNHRIDVSVEREPCLQDREADVSVEVLRMAAIGGVQRGGTSLVDPEATAKESREVLSGAVSRSLKAMVTKILDASWMQEGSSTDPHLRVAAEIFVRHLGVNVNVVAVEQRKDVTFLRITVALTIPIHVSCVRPLVDVAKSEEQQRFVLENVIEPVVTTLCKTVGLESKTEFFLSVMTRVFGVVHSARQRSNGNASNPIPPGVSKARMFNILHALSLHRSCVSIEFAVPRISLSNGAKTAALDLATELLKTFVTPTSATQPRVPAHDLIDFVVRLERVPTNVLEALNKIFSSTERIPSSRRTGSLDAVVSPQTKISMGLKFFGDIVVEVYRPYAPLCGAVILEEEEKSQSIFRKSPAMAHSCIPRADLPVDLVKSNVTIHEHAVRILGRVEEERQRSSAREMELKSKELVARLRDGVAASTFSATLKDEFQSLGLHMSKFYKAEISIALPYGLEYGTDCHLPVMYLAAQLCEKD